jgi:hypothetical protein
LSDPAQQMHAIAQMEFECTPILNQEESRLLPLLDSVTGDLQAGHRVMAQTSLGELIRPKATSGTSDERSAAFASINSKRLDFAIIDSDGRLVVAIEYQGSGHFQGNAFMRDAVKREAIRRAGIAYVEVEQDFDPALLRQRITGLLNPSGPAAAPSALQRRAAIRARASASSAATWPGTAAARSASMTSIKRNSSHQSHISLSNAETRSK